MAECSLKIAEMTQLWWLVRVMPPLCKLPLLIWRMDGKVLPNMQSGINRKDAEIVTTEKYRTNYNMILAQKFAI